MEGYPNAAELQDEKNHAENTSGKAIKLPIAIFLIFILLFGYLGLMRHGRTKKDLFNKPLCSDEHVSKYKEEMEKRPKEKGGRCCR